MRWIEHTPGPCPVLPDELVDLELIGGEIILASACSFISAQSWFWGDAGNLTIRRYRVRREPDAWKNVYPDIIGYPFRTRAIAEGMALPHRIGVLRIYLKDPLA